MVALAILAIFIPLFFSLYSYIDRTFSISNRQSDLQFYSRLTKIKLENEINLAPELEIRSDIPNVSGDQKAIYVDNRRIKLITYDAVNGVQVVSEFIPNIPNDVTMSLTFTKITDKNDAGEDLYGGKLLGFTITSNSADQTVDLDTSFLIESGITISGTTGTAILYKPKQ